MTGTISLIAGPTASGKSALALRLAEAEGAHIVNADSMQVYAVLRRLTARPGEAELARAPHHLYGHADPAGPYSVARWLDEVRTLTGRLEAGTPLIFTGGTGLYFKALTEGLSPVPRIPPQVRAHWRDRLAAEGPQALHTELSRRDGPGAAMLSPGDGQRLVRALEVIEATGRPLRDWQGQDAAPPMDAGSIGRRIVLMPDRKHLHERIDARFGAMVAAGALDEVRALRALGLDPRMPAMKAIGVRELAAMLDGTIDEGEAVRRARAASRQYAKRQMTWFRNQFGPQWRVVADPGTVKAGMR